MKRIVAVIDTGFDDSSAKVRKMWEGFSYEKIDLCGGGLYHSHGTLVAMLCFRPFDNDMLRDSVHFVHIRCGDSNGQFSEDNINRAFDLLWQKNATAVNCSWGGPKPADDSHRRMAEKILSIADGGVAFHFAAGNDGDSNPDDDISMPQSLLRRGQGTFLWGALAKAGKPASFSSDGEKLFASMWGSDRPAHGPDGLIAGVSGTSFASPTGCGMCEAMMAMGNFATYAELEDYLWRSAIHMTQTEAGIWIPYIDPVTGEPWHPKVGRGSEEHLFQGLTVNSRCRPQKVPAAAVRWFNFRRLY
ncbi:MAG: S8/S53 family peptidase [bacterium]|nr:S8/S53 family peptidase [bacterium]